ncbi:MAG: NAD(P)H-dependent oxidoreductase subunit E [Lachnospiraceae bacterium]|nr:NAD(P)H-dependent oxidoreductase subunit E [Lachnospiraceae bacterium]
MEEQIQEIMEYYTKEGETISQEDLVNMLREIQEVKGCIPAAVQKQVAEAAKVKETFLAALIKRYPSLKAENYRHEIQVCVGAGCSAKGSYDLLKILEKKWDIRQGEVSEGGRFYLRTSGCMKQCVKGPNMMIDKTVYHQVTEKSLGEILEKYQ